MLEMRRVRLLVEFARRGSLAAVSEALHLSASGVSAQIGQLEREVGQALVVRAGRGLRLTEAGERLAERGRLLLAEMETTEAELRELSGEVAGTLKIAVFQSAALFLIPDVLAAQKAFPALRIELVQAEPENAVPGLLAGSCDLVVAEEYPGVEPWIPDDTQRFELGQDPLCAVVSESLGAETCAELGQIPWVMERRGSAARQWAELTCRRFGFEPDVRYESDDLVVHLELIQRGLAAGMLPSLVASRAGQGLQWRPTGLSRTLLVLTRLGNARLPAVRSVSQELKKAFEEANSALLMPN